MFPEELNKKLDERHKSNSYRRLNSVNELIDFSSNDYLGFSKNKELYKKTQELLRQNQLELNGATGSRLISGNYSLYNITENKIAEAHNAETALLFNSGYTANLGLFSTLPQKGALIIYDELIHASIRDGILLSKAKSYKFRHNDLKHLEKKLDKASKEYKTIYVATESIFSMDGDQPDLNKIVKITKKYKSYLIVDEAHAIGSFGLGLSNSKEISKDIFARIVTYGKAMGVHGAAIIGDRKLKEYLINFCRPLIYTTGMSPHQVASIYASYSILKKSKNNITNLHNNINYFKDLIKEHKITRIESSSPIQSIIIGGNSKTKIIAENIKKNMFNVKAILSPTVKKGEERLRICLHSYNTKKDIKKLIEVMLKAIKNE